MKIESILARVNEITSIVADPDAISKLDALAADLAEMVRMECAHFSGTANATKTISALLKANKKSAPTETRFHYAWVDEEGRQCVCDGCRAFRLNEALPLEKRPADAGEHFEIEKVFPSDLKNEYAPFPLPDAKEIKAFIAIERAAKKEKRKMVWDFGNGLPAVNANFLLDLLNVLPDAKEIYCKDFVHPMYAKSERGDALLMPIFTEEKKKERSAIGEKYGNADISIAERRRRDARAAMKKAADPSRIFTLDEFAAIFCA